MSNTLQRDLENYLTEMKLLILRSKITQAQYDQLVEASKTLSEVDLGVLHSDVFSLYTNEWRAAQKVWVLPAISNPERAPEIWAQYDAMQIVGTPEQDLLTDALVELRNSFKKVAQTWLPRRKNQN